MERNTAEVNTVMLIGMHEALTPALLQQIYPEEQNAEKNSGQGCLKALARWITSQLKVR